MVEQPALALHAAAVTGERAVGSDHAMTGDNHANWIRSVGETDGPDREGTANFFSKLAVGERFAAGDRAEGFPDLALEWSSRGLHGEFVYCRKVSGEIALHRI